MNSFAHALPYLDQPYKAIGCCVPDILAAVDRRCRARKKRALAWVDHEQAEVALIAQGVVQHHIDDGWFHRSADFNNLNIRFAVEFREQFERGHSMRPSLIGHILIEIFLDCFLHQQFPDQLEQFYQLVDHLDHDLVENTVNRFATRPTNRLAKAMARFVSERYLFDYETDEGVHYRMSRVLERLNLLPLPDDSIAWLGEVRQVVYRQADGLLHQFALDWQ